MSENGNPLDEPMIPTEQVHPDHREHAKTGHRIDEDELARRAEHERDEVGADGPEPV